MLLRLYRIQVNQEGLRVEGKLAEVKVHLEVGGKAFAVVHTAVRQDGGDSTLAPTLALLVAKGDRRPMALGAGDKLIEAQVMQRLRVALAALGIKARVGSRHCIRSIATALNNSLA